MRAQAWETVTRAGRPIQGAALYQRDQVHAPRFCTHGFARGEKPYGSHPKWAGGSLAKAGEAYYLADSTIVQPYNENAFRWELLEWS